MTVAYRGPCPYMRAASDVRAQILDDLDLLIRLD
jgi:hypothetical protein